MQRRAFLTGIAAALAAPAIVRAESLMQIAVLKETVRTGNHFIPFEQFCREAHAALQEAFKAGDTITISGLTEQGPATYRIDKVVGSVITLGM